MLVCNLPAYSLLLVSEEQVMNYYRAQRTHQNNVESMSVFMPIFLVAGLFEPKNVAIAGSIVLIFRLIGGIGYLYGKRIYGAPWHIGELYLLYIVGKIAYKMLFKKEKTKNIAIENIENIENSK